MKESLLAGLDSESLSSGEGGEEIGDEVHSCPASLALVSNDGRDKLLQEYEDLLTEKDVSYVRRLGPEFLDSDQNFGDSILQVSALRPHYSDPVTEMERKGPEAGRMGGRERRRRER